MKILINWVLVIGALSLMVLILEMSVDKVVPQASYPDDIMIDTTSVDTIPQDIQTEIVSSSLEYEKPKIPRNFSLVPTSKHIYRSSQPKLDQLKYLLTKYPIKYVIRMNGEEGTGVTIGDEKKLVESLGAKFLWVDAHMGYQKGMGYVGSLSIVQPILDSGNVLIHCTAGKDRTGYMVGKYLQDHTDMTMVEIWNYTTSMNEWEIYIPQGKRGYIKYMEAFYPYDIWLLDKKDRKF